jgi:hypothetical protein
MNPGHFRWPADADIPLFLVLADEDGQGVVGQVPQVAIRRYREAHGSYLDNWYWDGSTFVSIPTYHNMAEVDSVNLPGEYSYHFEQSLVGLEIQYLVYFKNDGYPPVIAHETHIITNEVYIPHTQPDPIIIGPQSVMGQLELVKDGGTGLFDGLTDSLHFLRADTARILGLLHQNGMVDKQQYDSNGQLTYARLRVFDSAVHVPPSPGGNEVLGKTQEYEIRAQYDGPNIVRKFELKRVL